jgi:hypothetical protein
MELVLLFYYPQKSVAFRKSTSLEPCQFSGFPIYHLRYLFVCAIFILILYLGGNQTADGDGEFSAFCEL